MSEKLAGMKGHIIKHHILRKEKRDIFKYDYTKQKNINATAEIVNQEMDTLLFGRFRVRLKQTLSKFVYYSAITKRCPN